MLDLFLNLCIVMAALTPILGTPTGPPSVRPAPPTARPTPPCPTLCTCHEAPLHAAPFVELWLRREAAAPPRPALHLNEVLNPSAVAASHSSAPDAGVDMEAHGTHATCALHPASNLTELVSGLPRHTMVLTLLQAAGCNYTVIEGDQLARLSQLRALHLQGFANRRRRHISGLKEDNSTRDYYHAQDSLHEDVIKDFDNSESQRRYWKSLTMALADDALQSLIHLEILDLQYVRLIAKGDAKRPRRHTWGPISTTNIIDMPLRKFFRYANDINSVQLPRNGLFNDPNFVQASKAVETPDNEEEMKELLVDYYYETIMKKAVASVMEDELDIVLLNDTNQQTKASYAVHQNEKEDFFAPFSSQVSLKYLRIANAHLDALGPELLAGLMSLHTLTLESNKIHVLPVNVFATSPNLKHLSLAHNSILTLDGKSLQGLNNLISLDLSKNRLTIIGSGSLPNLPKLKKLILEGNPIQHVLPDSFVGVNGTDTLTIGSTDVEVMIHRDALRQVNNLKSLKVMNISQQSFNSGFFKFVSKLEDLTLHGDLAALNFDAFSEVQSLKNLDLSSCQITRVSVDAFFGLSNLIRLDLSNNNLSVLSPGVFDHMKELREMFLQNNNIKTIPIGLFAPLKLRILRLHNNPWECTCNLLQLNPLITNSILQAGYKICSLDEKFITHCSTVGDKLMFDSRVAPKCSTPVQFKNRDAYTVAHRFLKCSKLKWDPAADKSSVVQTNKDVMKRKWKIKTENFEKLTTTTLSHEMQSDQRISGDERKWKPLTDFTPKPLAPLDLLSIAESEMLEEANEVLTTEAIPQPPKVVLHDGLSKEEQKKILKESMDHYRASKNKIKQRIQAQRVRMMKRIVRDGGVPSE